MNGVFGKYLQVNLSKGSAEDYKIPDSWYEKHLGGRGIAARIMLKELERGVDPLGEKNILIFATGPFQGTGIPGGGRNVIMAKSPKTNAVSDSYVGGFFGHELGRSGYDGIIVRGKAKGPKYVLIDEEARIEDAKELWGLTTGETDDILKKKHPGVRVTCIGPAGEKLVKFACVINDKNRGAGRPGFGAVMGSKNLKAIVVKGKQEKKLHDKKRLTELKKKFARNLVRTKEGLGLYGTSMGVNRLNERGILPTKNFQEGVFEGAGLISGQHMTDTILKNRDSCTGCPIRCKRVVRTEFDGEKVKEEYGGPEYETIASFGSLCFVDDLNAISLANQICNAYGLDTISAGVTVAFVMEASEKGMINYKLEWGDSKGMIDLVKKIATRSGIGDMLANGIDHVAEKLGMDFAMEVKHQEIPMHEPRGKKGLGLSYATSPRGATHLETTHDTSFEETPVAPELGLKKAISRFDLMNKPKYVKVFEDLNSFGNSLIICRFTTIATGEDYNYPEIRKMLRAVTGLEVDANEMLKIGERNYVLLKILSAREGYGKKDDGLPKRFSNPLPRGGSAGQSMNPEELQNAIDEYYKLRGFDERGPTNKKLEKLGLSEFKGMF